MPSEKPYGFFQAISAYIECMSSTLRQSVEAKFMRFLPYIYKRPTAQQFYDRHAIVRRIAIILIVVVILQSSKLWFGHGYFGTSAVASLKLHTTNLSVHLLIFASVLWYLKQDRLLLAIYLLLGGFFSYISFACYIWAFNLNLHYYFLLSMFVSCYLFDHHQRVILGGFITAQLLAFISCHISLPTVYSLDTIYHANGAVTFLANLGKVNALVFACASLLCALFIRAILSENWRQLQYYRELQQRLLSKVFPSTLMPSLIDSQRYPNLQAVANCKPRNLQPWSFEKLRKHDYSLRLKNDQVLPLPDNIGAANASMQTAYTMGVVFLDICEFAKMTTAHSNLAHFHQPEKGDSKASATWQTIYSLFAKFDRSLTHIDARRIKTNGDQYILLVGFESHHQTRCHIAAQTLQACIALQKTSFLKVKIGAALGSVTCGVFDPNHPQFDIWGETVIRAARLEALASANEIIVDTYLQEFKPTLFSFLNKRNIHLKGLGEHEIYTLAKKL